VVCGDAADDHVMSHITNDSNKIPFPLMVCNYTEMEASTNDDSNLSRVSDDTVSVASTTIPSASPTAVPANKRRSNTSAPAVSADNVRTTSRRRTKTTRFDFDFLENEEQMYLQQVSI
jgi:hypothetical protein